MIGRNVRGWIVLMTVALSMSALAQDGRSDALSLDDWRSLSQQARSEVFVLFSPSKRAQIVSAHLSAWREEHRANLSAAQLDLIEEAITVVKPAAYDESSAARQQFRGFEKAFLARARLVFLDEEIAELFYMQFEPKPRRK